MHEHLMLCLQNSSPTPPPPSLSPLEFQSKTPPPPPLLWNSKMLPVVLVWISASKFTIKAFRSQDVLSQILMEYKDIIEQGMMDINTVEAPVTTTSP